MPSTPLAPPLACPSALSVGAKLAGLAVRTRLQAGTVQTDGCYATRNKCNMDYECNLFGTKKEKTEMNFRDCLYRADDPMWYQELAKWDPQCTSAERCRSVVTAGGTECYNLNEGEILPPIDHDEGVENWLDCLRPKGLMMMNGQYVTSIAKSYEPY